MCQFFSALALRNGQVLCHPMLDSHSDLVTYFKLPDGAQWHQHFAKVELVPVDWMDVSTWEFTLDDETEPGWWNDVAGNVESSMRAKADAMILRSGKHRLIVDGCWIVGGNAIVTDVRGGRILRVQDSAQIRDVQDSAQIRGVWDSAQIRDVGGWAQILGVWGSAQIHGVRDSAQILDVQDSAQIRDVQDSAQIRDVRDSAILDGSARAHVAVA